jgi:hypothetical protein
MRSRTDTRLAPRQRLARGLRYTAVGPVDITRGVLGLSANSAQTTASTLRRRYRTGRLRRELAAAQNALAAELAAAQEVVTNLPQTLQNVGKPKRRRRPLILIGVGAAVLAGGAVTFSIVRRSMKPEPSPLPPSVEVAPRP